MADRTMYEDAPSHCYQNCFLLIRLVTIEYGYVEYVSLVMLLKVLRSRLFVLSSICNGIAGSKVLLVLLLLPVDEVDSTATVAELSNPFSSGRAKA